MLNNEETANGNPVTPLTSQHQNQLDATLSTYLSYTIGPIDAAKVVTTHIHVSDEEACTLLIPKQLPSSILNDPAFQDACKENYLSEEEIPEEKEWAANVIQLVNHVYASLTDTRCYLDFTTGEVLPDFLPWQVGWLLRDLTSLAEVNQTLAYVGIAHLCFVLSLLTPEDESSTPSNEAYYARFIHSHTVKAYRTRVRIYMKQGKSLADARYAALY